MIIRACTIAKIFYARHLQLLSTESISTLKDEVRMLVDRADKLLQDPTPPNQQALLSLRTELSTKFYHLIEQDQGGQPPYLNYALSIQALQTYVNLLLVTTKKWSPNAIQQNSSDLSRIMLALSRYPLFALTKPLIFSTHQAFCQALNLKSEQELNKALLFTLKADASAEESLVYGQFLKFYLRVPSETLKAKYQIALKDETLGGFLKKITSKMLQRGFLRRTPGYSRSLSILYPTDTLCLLIQNPSTSQSLMIRKIFYQHIFSPIVRFYEGSLKQNIYNVGMKDESGRSLWEMLNQCHKVIFNLGWRSELVEEEAQYLRELYVTLFLVIRQKMAMAGSALQCDVLEIYSGCLLRTYEWLHVHNFSQNSPKARLFAAQFEEYMADCLQIQSRADRICAIAGLREELFLLQKHFGSRRPQQLKRGMRSVLEQQLSPLVFQLHFQRILLYFKWICEEQGSDTLLSLLERQCGLFAYLPLPYCNELAQLIGKYGSQANVLASLKLYIKMIEGVVNREYKEEELNLETVTTLLQIYSHHTNLISPLDLENHAALSGLRLFLLRYIADHHAAYQTFHELQRILQTLVILDDTNTFDDGDSNYPLHIFQEIKQTVKDLLEGTIPPSLKGASPKLILLLQHINSKYYNKTHSLDTHPAIQELIDGHRHGRADPGRHGRADPGRHGCADPGRHGCSERGGPLV